MTDQHSPHPAEPAGGPSWSPVGSADDPWTVTDRDDDAPDGFEDGVDEEPPASPRALTLSIASVALALLLAAAAALPLPYVVSSPGPTLDTLSDHEGTPLIEVSGAETYPTTGELRLTTVTTAGGPGYPVTLGDVLRGWFSSARSVVPVEQVFAPAQTREEVTQTGQAEMISSQEDATVSALEELGYMVPTTLTVGGVMADTGAEGVLQEGDVITGVGGTPVTSFSDLSSLMDAVTPGDTVTLQITRDGAPTDVDVTTTELDGRALLGVLIDPVFDFPVDVSIQIENIGGPSAGTMFALGIIDKMTPEDEANGQVIAGTGTIDLTGTVGPIGGIEQKMFGAVRDGATWFLAPADNCADVVGHVPEGLHVVRIATLHEAREAVQAIGEGDAAGLPTCS
ncbi:PDZ domain-containing protein [Actinotalea sp. M2MS4P-6]|uniref:YlbL family protein n=1 Tax=Actinotalea sp. M2MS4P-6 TaxID=2983762 RepID=UPI0021E4B6F8|nr:S16 family serine protease [Actinotalea sp. M2MS4P-6]MCV2394509.1 PDZ domain-containing protein [Actinotalea sp. M2MS4P-6]